MRIIGIALAPAIAAGAAVLAMPQASARPVPGYPPCNNQPSFDYLIWERRPRLMDSAFEIGDTGPHCTSSLDGWAASQPTGTGYCSKIALSSDNPGYDTEARPAAPLRKVIEAVGDC
ncbi:hypothetical protein MNAB215_2743 [Mycobacterium numidiamassiliense]|uniref:Secreted protein n=1 Tax=Mycobacterium numidiamassiliense TaxID=1841861 RepID=A0A2U3P9Y0_9MYCO|nr:hypothetical protein [Mycobacterium numidiamassiliense]SPM40542.1 hypothetical protein MNAB215_2743 [Mycobacterium numidiamassiliense]